MNRHLAGSGSRSSQSSARVDQNSINPVQSIAHDRPAFPGELCISSENPVIIERLDRIVLFLEVDPQSQELCKLGVSPRNRVRERYLDHDRMRDGHREGGIEKGPERASLGGQDQRVNRLALSFEVVVDALEVDLNRGHARELPLDEGKGVRYVGNGHTETGSAADPGCVREVCSAMVRDYKRQRLVEVAR